MFNQTTMFVHEQEEFKFQPQINNYLDKGL
jgi:hypothetical protein